MKLWSAILRAVSDSILAPIFGADMYKQAVTFIIFLLIVGLIITIVVLSKCISNKVKENHNLKNEINRLQTKNGLFLKSMQESEDDIKNLKLQLNQEKLKSVEFMEKSIQLEEKNKELEKKLKPESTKKKTTATKKKKTEEKDSIENS